MDEKNMTAKLSLRLPPVLHAQVQEEARKANQNYGEYVRWVLTQQMRRVEKRKG